MMVYKTYNLITSICMCYVLASMLLIGCATKPQQIEQSENEKLAISQNSETFYAMRPSEIINSFRPGDIAKIDIFNEQELSGAYEVDSSGFILMPYIGSIEANGKTSEELTSSLVQRYGEGYFHDPTITVNRETIVQSRRFVVDGAVKKPGVYDLVENIKFTEGIAMAGGLAKEANKNAIMVVRYVNGKRIAFPLDFETIHLARAEDLFLLSSDVIYVQSEGEKFEAKDVLQWLPLVNTAMLAAIRF